jgi:ABC-2 type transport system ATP-binding protein
MDAAIRTTKLTKYYGPTRGIEDLDLQIHRGEVFGYLGPNGAGKSTTIRLLIDLIRATSGTAQVLGMDTRRDALAIRHHIGYLPGELALYENLTGRELLDFLGRLREIDGIGTGDQLAERLSLDLSRPIRSLSRGNKQKVGLVQALMHSPEVLILDEPTSGLDPLVQHEFQKLIGENTDRGVTVLLSSHILSEIEHMTHRVGIIRSGSLVVVEEIDALKRKALTRIDIRFARDDVATEVFKHVSGVRRVDGQGKLMTITIEGSLDALIKTLAQFEVSTIKTHEPNLEEVFLTYYQGADDAV